MKTTAFAHQLTAFLTKHLPSQRNASAHTIKAYRDSFVLFLRYCRDERRCPPDRIDIADIDAPVILDYLEFLCKNRRCSASTRNARLAAMRSFFRFVQTEAPEYLMQCQRVLSIPAFRSERRAPRYLSPLEMKLLLSQPDCKSRFGMRDAALLSLLYDTGARVHELSALRVGDVRLDTPAQVRLNGKGRKTRIVPLMTATAGLLAAYMKSANLSAQHRVDDPLFPGRHEANISRFGIRYILDKYVKQLRAISPATTEEAITPHSLRHSKAMHLLEANTPLPIIRDILGHDNIGTTEIYARASTDMKRAALEKASNCSPGAAGPVATWRQDPDLLDWLKAL